MTSKLELSSLSSALLELLLVQTNLYISVLFLTKNVNIPNGQVVNGSRRPPDPEYKDGLDGNWLTPHQEKLKHHPQIYKEIQKKHTEI